MSDYGGAVIVVGSALFGVQVLLWKTWVHATKHRHFEEAYWGGQFPRHAYAR
jgi:hypothetical protein